MRTCLSTCLSVQLSKHAYARVCTRVCACVRMHVYTCVCTRVYTGWTAMGLALWVEWVFIGKQRRPNSQNIVALFVSLPYYLHYRPISRSHSAYIHVAFRSCYIGLRLGDTAEGCLRPRQPAKGLGSQPKASAASQTKMK